MRRLARIFLLASSLLFSTAIVFFWVRSYWISDNLYYWRGKPNLPVELGSHRGIIYITNEPSLRRFWEERPWSEEILGWHL